MANVHRRHNHVVSERLIRLFAGILVLGGTFFGYFVDLDWFLFTGFVGLFSP
jgi:hypothetical protein